MLRTFAVTHDLKLLKDVPIERLSDSDIKWCWVDFDSPSKEEIELLHTYFQFHPLAIEDCMQFIQRPKVDYFEGYNFFVLHTLNQETQTTEEMDVFLGKDFIVTFHLNPSFEIETVMRNLAEDKQVWDKGTSYMFYLLMDEIVDVYFPIVYQIEDSIGDVELKEMNQSLMEQVFKIRNQLLKLRRTVLPMSELLYRIINSERAAIPKEEKAYFMNIYDHLIKLNETIELNREMTNDIRDSYISINSDKMNNIMKTLTVMSSVFIPLTFIAGIYGMNFSNMPELTWSWGYYGVLGLMVIVGSGMLVGLWNKGWLGKKKNR